MDKALTSLSKEQLIERIEELEEQVKLEKAFASITESNNGDAILHWQGRNRFLSEKVIPVQLKPVKEKSVSPQKGNHRVIDGDNLAVMTSLLSEFRGGANKGVDVIYVDPPYNTGEDVFSYSDDYRLSNSEVKAIRRKVGRSESLVSLDDPNRHTKWINHMAPRLWAAKKLLKSTGVIIVSIDEHELPRLWMLMEELFGANNRIATMVWERARKNDAKYISEGHEYMVLWARNKTELDGKKARMGMTPEWAHAEGRWRKRKDGVDEILTAYMEAKVQHGDDLAKIKKAMTAFFGALPAGHPAKKIRYKKVNQWGMYNDDGDLNWPGGGGPLYDVPHRVTKKPCKPPISGWRFQEPEMKALLELPKTGQRERIAFKASHTGTPRYIRYLDEVETEVRTSVMSRTGQRSVEVVEAILGKGSFKNPKDHEILAELFNLVTWRDKNAVILDPYAGSGTTAHSVLAMNAEDNGNRRFILIESGDPTDKKISRSRYVNEITAERVRRVITGRWADGKHHPPHKTGFHFYRAHDEITKAAIMASTRETLADIILQVVEEESNRIDCRVEGHTYLIGRTRLGYGIALVWQPTRGKTAEPILTWKILEKVLDEAEAAGVTKPVHIYATANTAPITDDLYRFHQIPNSILASLGILNGDRDSEE
jgi:adenine-specific DNA-methyltransferase